MNDIAAVNPFDLLGVFAQISVAFAGFGSIASGLSQRPDGHDYRVDAGRLINMLVVTLSTMMLALLPSLAALLRLEERDVWGLSAMVAATAVLILTPGVMARAARIRRHSGYNNWAMLTYFSLAMLALAGFLCCALGMPAYALPAGYLGGLTALQLICVILFFRITASLLRAPVRK